MKRNYNLLKLLGIIFAIVIMSIGVYLQGIVPSNIEYPLGFIFGVFTSVTLAIFYFPYEDE